jgi:hypothetical protein
MTRVRRFTRDRDLLDDARCGVTRDRVTRVERFPTILDLFAAINWITYRDVTCVYGLAYDRVLETPVDRIARGRVARVLILTRDRCLETSIYRVA